MSAKTLNRFLAKIDKTGPCWIWKGALDHSGTAYGKFRLNGKIVSAHRLSFRIHHGKIPRGLFVLHGPGCVNKACVNPAHLHLGTHQQNVDEYRAFVMDRESNRAYKVAARILEAVNQ